MTQKEQINKQLNDEYDGFLYSKYTGKIAPPKDIIELFKTAILALPPFAHKINFHRVKAIVTTKYEDLTNGNLNDMVKVILNTPLEKLYESTLTPLIRLKGDDLFLKIVDKCITVDKFVLCYNNHVDEFRKKLEMKKATLESLSGARNNGLRIIPQA